MTPEIAGDLLSSFHDKKEKRSKRCMTSICCLYTFFFLVTICHCCLLTLDVPSNILSGVQYRMPEAYDEEGGVNQEKRFSVALQRYRSV